MIARSYAIGILLLLLSLFGLSLAQSQPGKQSASAEPKTVVKTTTRLVIVDVVATNGKGEPISDLKTQDFKVLENGKEQEIRVFDFQHPGQKVAAPSAAAAPPVKLP